MEIYEMKNKLPAVRFSLFVFAFYSTGSIEKFKLGFTVTDGM